MARSQMRLIIALMVAAVWTMGGLPVAAQQQANSTTGAVADIKDAAGKTIATAELREDLGKVQVALSLPSPSPLSGKHALHIMEVGRCDPPDFLSAGAIFNPFGKQHGILASGGAMVGDLPNLTMPLQRYNAPALGASIAPGPGSLLGQRGTALVIYANVDDEQTNPDGNSGARVACGVIRAADQATTAGQAVPTGQSSTGGVTFGPALLIAALGAVLIGAGLFLRTWRRNQ
jgi:Cu-Zn family superoxide dismutase